MGMKKSDNKTTKRRKEVILLQDLAPQKNVKGGSGRILFGQGINPGMGTQKKEHSDT